MKGVTERILNLTLEIIYLLTGEDYTLVRKSSGDHVTANSYPFKSRGWISGQKPIMKPPPERNDQKILEVTQKMIELLTGEVPIRCQDVSVYFSTEEWEYLEGHKNLYKDIVMVEDQPPLTLPDGSSNRNTPATGPSLQNSTEEDHNIPFDQGENVITIKAEVQEEEEDTFVKGYEVFKDEEIPPDISTGIQPNTNDPRQLQIIVQDDEEDTFTSEEVSSTLYLSCPDLSSDHFTNQLPPGNPYMDHSQRERFPYFKHEEDAQREELILLQRSYGKSSEIMREKTFSCLEYGEGFTQMPSHIKHNSLHSESKSHSCLECGKSFSQKTNLIIHQKDHKGEQPMSYLECGEQFARTYSLMSHESLRVGEKPYSCTECGKCFSRKANFITHQQFHTGEKPFSCSECGEQFTRKSSLLEHENLHMGMRPYSCTDCGKCFSRNANLLMHKKVHTGEKPFFCLECGERFTRKSSLNRHQIVHTGVKPFSCPQCGECFNRSSSLIRHRKVHMVKSYSCLECGKCFQLRSHLVYHKQTFASKSYSCSDLNQGVTGTLISLHKTCL